MNVTNKWLIKVLKDNFKFLMIDEFRTSKLYWKTNLPAQKIYKTKIVDGKEKRFKLHAVLSYKTTKGTRYINRDNNSVNNMLKIVKNIINFGVRPKEFVRKLEKTKFLLTYLEPKKSKEAKQNESGVQEN